MNHIIYNISIITPHDLIPDGWVSIENGVIIEVAAGPIPKDVLVRGDICTDGEGCFLSPGFIDLHVHGGADADFGDANKASFLRALETHFRGGTTTIVPTFMSAGLEVILSCGAVFQELYQDWDSLEGIPRLAGIHLEGPYFSPNQLGAQDKTYVRDPRPEEYRHILDAVPHIIRWSAACEQPGAIAFGEYIASRGVTPCIGHSDATTAQVRQAVNHGYRCVTHLYSSCSMVHRNGPFREGGIVEAAYLLDQLDVELIGDGIHMPPDFLNLVYKIKGPEHIALITDCIRPGGRRLPDGTQTYSDAQKRRPVIIQDGVAVMPDRSCFAGSIVTMGTVVETCVKKGGLPLCDVVRMASLTPARMLGIDGAFGSITPGKRADFVLLDQQLHIRAVMLANGEKTPKIFKPEQV